MFPEREGDEVEEMQTCTSIKGGKKSSQGHSPNQETGGTRKTENEENRYSGVS